MASAVIPLLGFFLSACATLVARHFPPGGPPQKTPAEYLRDLDVQMKGMLLEKSAFSAASMENAYTYALRPDGIDFSYRKYLSILSTDTRPVTTRCDFTDIGEVSVVEYSTRGGRAPHFSNEIPLGPRCGGLGLFNGSKEALLDVAQTLLMLQQANGKAPQRPTTPPPSSQGI